MSWDTVEMPGATIAQRKILNDLGYGDRLIRRMNREDADEAIRLALKIHKENKEGRCPSVTAKKEEPKHSKTRKRDRMNFEEQIESQTVSFVLTPEKLKEWEQQGVYLRLTVETKLNDTTSEDKAPQRTTTVTGAKLFKVEKKAETAETAETEGVA